MTDFRISEAFNGMESVWAVWVTALALIAAGLVRAARSFQPPTPARLAADESGLSYTLTYVMTIPVYLFFLLIVYESSWLLVAKIGTMYAAHAGARSAVVWEPMRPDPAVDARIGQAVNTAMAPFATADLGRASADGRTPPTSAAADAEEFAHAYSGYSAEASQVRTGRRRPFGLHNASPKALKSFYLTAAARTEYTCEVDTTRPDGPVRCVVTYYAPLRVPGPARWLDPDGQWPYEYPVKSWAVLPAEGPDTADRTLGIDYQSRTRGVSR